MAKKIKILIPNATGPSNPGDQAILHSMIGMLRKLPVMIDEIALHSTDHHLYKKSHGFKVKPTIYMWAGFQNKNPLVRMIRLMRLLLSYLTTKFGFSVVISRDLRVILKDYKRADLIVFAGGGYLRSQKGLTQTLNLLMNLAMFQFAKLYRKKTIVAPISIGPFGYEWHEKLTARTMKEFAAVFLREERSYNVLKNYNVKNIIHANDLALLATHPRTKKTSRDTFIVGFTIRDWLPKEKQLRLETAYAVALSEFSKKTGALIQPIAQVDNNMYGDRDRDVAAHVIEKLHAAGVKTLPIKTVKEYPGDTIVYGEIDLLMGMRMHSLIFAILQNTPFVAVSYEHKTEGLMQTLGLSHLCVQSSKATEKNLRALLFEVYEKRDALKKSLASSLLRIKAEEEKRWKELLTQWLTLSVFVSATSTL
ncbi:MAG: hypothetical protein RLZZ455_431 [Candidatus Parcubacteria bacterium]|jgi:polysaccharide pyruvyl transferase WcaK-like protein